MIRIQVITYNGLPPLQPIVATFNDLGGNIGRADGNALILPDPRCHISRLHASIALRAGGYVIRDFGTATPVYVNSHPLGNGQEASITSGDEIRIGGYTMRVTGFDPLVNPTPPPSPPLPDNWDADVLPSHPNRKSMVDDFKLGPDPFPPGHRLAPPPDQPRVGPLVVPEVVPSRPKPPAVSPIVSPTTEHPKSSGVPEIEIVPSPQPQPSPPITEDTPRRETPHKHNELLRAFLGGAGVPDLAVPGELTPQMMSMFGQLLRESTQGTLDLLLARALTKQVTGIDLTIIVGRENNPLKFSPNVEVALAYLLAPQGPGVMKPLEAVKDAYNDLRSHQFGFMAGMRAALAGVLERFNPERLEQRLTQKTMIDSLFPMNRKAKLWDLCSARYYDIAKEAEDDFNALFGKEFLRAYKAQIAKLEQDDKDIKP